MKNALKALAVLVAATALPFAAADARPAKCLLQVDGRNYIDRTCNFEAESDGSFTIGTDEHPITFFAYVNKNGDGTADASWNGTDRESHAQTPLGTVRRDHQDPACWINAHATICAW